MHLSFPVSCRPGLRPVIALALGVVPAGALRAGDPPLPARSHLQPVSEMARSPATGAGLGVSLLSPDLVRQRHGDALAVVDTGAALAPTRFTCIHAGTVPEAVTATILRAARREMAREPCFRPWR